MKTLIIVLLLFVLINIGYVYFLWEATQISIWEIRFYLGYSLIIGSTIAFGILRIYNAVVSNTRFIILLRRAMKEFSTTAKDFSRDVSTHTTAINSLKTAVKNLGNKVGFKK